MPAASLPPDETARLNALRALDVLDTPSEAEFDGIVRLAARLCGTPTALVSLVDADRQWFKARVGMAAPETPRDQAVCGHAILKARETLIIPDTQADARTRDNPLCGGETPLRFYAGVPLLSSDGLALGTLCVLDTVPHQGGLTPDQTDSLQVLARQTEVLLEARRTALREAVLRREAVHRGKNVIGVIQALVTQTIRRADSLEGAASAVRRRLTALSAAYDLLRGGGDRIELSALVALQLEPFGAEDRIEAGGPRVFLTARAAEGIGLALHELATNAAKYGVLSGPKGRIAIRWTQEADGGVRLTWREEGGPAPRGDTAATDGGFGRVVIERVAGGAIGGPATLELAPEGARWTARIEPNRLAG